MYYCFVQDNDHIIKTLRDGGIELDHPLTVKYRVPMVPNMYTPFSFPVAVLAPGDDYVQTLDIVEDEAQLISRFIDFTNEKYLNKHFIARMKDLPVDIDSGVNTLTLIKTATGWRYRRRTWDQLYAPTFDQPAIESLDALFATIGGNSWHEWLAAQESTQES